MFYKLLQHTPGAVPQDKTGGTQSRDQDRQKRHNDFGKLKAQALVTRREIEPTAEVPPARLVSRIISNPLSKRWEKILGLLVSALP